MNERGQLGPNPMVLLIPPLITVFMFLVILMAAVEVAAFYDGSPTVAAAAGSILSVATVRLWDKFNTATEEQ